MSDTSNFLESPPPFRPLLVGEAPGPNTRADCPLFPIPGTSAGGRLCRMSGLRRADYVRLMRLNLLPTYPGKKWPREEAADAARNVCGGGLLLGRNTLLVGARVKDAFSEVISVLRMAEPCEPLRGGWNARGGLVAWIPHPSGRNLWYKSQGNRDTVSVFLKEYLKCEC